MKMNNKILNQVKNPKASPVVPDKEPKEDSSVRARSVSKDYKKFMDYSKSWRDQEKQELDKKQSEGCTFKPDLRKSKGKFKNQSQYSTYYSTAGNQPNTSRSATQTASPSMTPNNATSPVPELSAARPFQSLESQTPIAKAKI